MKRLVLVMLAACGAAPAPAPRPAPEAPFPPAMKLPKGVHSANPDDQRAQLADVELQLAAIDLEDTCRARGHGLTNDEHIADTADRAAALGADNFAGYVVLTRLKDRVTETQQAYVGELTRHGKDSREAQHARLAGLRADADVTLQKRVELTYLDRLGSALRHEGDRHGAFEIASLAALRATLTSTPGYHVPECSPAAINIAAWQAQRAAALFQEAGERYAAPHPLVVKRQAEVDDAQRALTDLIKAGPAWSDADQLEKQRTELAEQARALHSLLDNKP